MNFKKGDKIKFFTPSVLYIYEGEVLEVKNSAVKIRLESGSVLDVDPRTLSI